jgi:hypothetical protein
MPCLFCRPRSRFQLHQNGVFSILEGLKNRSGTPSWRTPASRVCGEEELRRSGTSLSWFKRCSRHTKWAGQHVDSVGTISLPCEHFPGRHTISALSSISQASMLQTATGFVHMGPGYLGSCMVVRCSNISSFFLAVLN